MHTSQTQISGNDCVARGLHEFGKYKLRAAYLTELGPVRMDGQLCPCLAEWYPAVRRWWRVCSVILTSCWGPVKCIMKDLAIPTQPPTR